MKVVRGKVIRLSYPMRADNPLRIADKAWMAGYLKLVESYRKTSSARYSAHLTNVAVDLGRMAARLWLYVDEREELWIQSVIPETFLNAWGNEFAAIFKTAYNKYAGIEVEPAPSHADSTLASCSAPDQSLSDLAGKRTFVDSAYPGSGQNLWASCLNLSPGRTAEVDKLSSELLVFMP